MKYFLITLFFLLAVKSLSSQKNYVISGRCIDSITHAAVPGATISFSAGDAKNAEKSTITTADGSFSFRDVQRLNAKVSISCIGYQNKVLMITESLFNDNGSLNLPAIYLAAVSKQLQGVVVTAVRPLIKQEIDRLSYDVQADPENKTLSVLEMMSKVPMLSVDADENIKLKGSGNYKIFINGRPSSLVARSPREALRAMQANTVLRIEVITTPPAKYDAEGLGGIINIVMVKKLTDGYNGSVGTNYNNAIGFSQSASIAGKKGKFGITGRGYVFQDTKQVLDTKTERESFAPTATFLSQEGRFSYVGNYSTESMEISYEHDSLNLITASANLITSRYNDQTNKASRLFNERQQVVQSYQSVNTNPQHETGLDFDINYQLGFRHQKDQLLTFSYQFKNAPNTESNDVLISNQYNFRGRSYMQANKNGTQEQTIQMDYVQPTKRFIVEGGVKAILRHNFSDFSGTVFEGATSGYGPDNTLNNQFDYNQHIYSLYNSWHVKLKQLEIKAGFRVEHTTVNANFITDTGTFLQNYSNVIPVASVQHKFSNSAINLGYTQRISRPGIYQLNPFVDRSNPQFISTGNPDLKAVLNNSFQLSYSAYGKLNFNAALSLSFANNSIELVTTLLDTVSYTVYKNVGKNKSAGLNGGISYPLTKKLSVSLNSQLNYLWLDGTYNGQRYTNKGVQGFAYANFIFKLQETWRVTTSLTFVSANILLQGSTNAFVFNSYRFYKDLFNKNLTVSFAVSNPYSKYRYVKTKTNTKDFTQLVSSQKNYRMFAMSLNYNFGSLKSEIKRNKRSISNDDVSGKSK